MDSDDPSPERANKLNGQRALTRRAVLGGLATVGASSAVVDSTLARFGDAETGSGTIQIDDQPTLAYDITDETENNKAEYMVAYQVGWVANFDRIEIQVENLNNSKDNETYSLTTEEGVVDYPRDGGSLGGSAGQMFRFTFDVFETGNSTPVISEVVEDEADGSGKEQGDFGSSNSTDLVGVTVTDNSSLQQNKAIYTVEYELENVRSSFDQVLVTFDNLDKDSADRTKSASTTPTGSVSYNRGGAEGHDYEITVEVVKDNGLTVDSHTISDTADGNDASWSQ